MKTKLYILILTLVVNIGYAQYWNPFVLNQNSYYKQEVGQSIQVENFLVDSVRSSEAAEVLYFNAKTNLNPNCYRVIMEERDNYGLINPEKIDSLIRRTDSVLFIANYFGEPDTLIFKPYVTLNESWTTQGITIRCAHMGESSVLGTLDSIKTFTCSGSGYDTIEFVLSKNYGFIKFLPLNEFLYHSELADFSPYFELMGYTKGATSVGYTQPDFLDYFNLSPGGLLYWRNYSGFADPREPASITYHLDSIFATYISSDSVHYDYKRTYFDEDGQISHIGNYTSYYLRKREGAMLQNHTSWFGLQNDYSDNEIYSSGSLSIVIEDDDTITCVQFQYPGLSINTIECGIEYIMDYHRTIRFTTREGMVYQGFSSWGESSSSLMGSVINGIEKGETEIPVGLNAISSNSLQVYPNPAKDFLHIQAETLPISIALYNCEGRQVKFTERSNILNVADLKMGVYILEVKLQEATVTRKLIKE